MERMNLKQLLARSVSGQRGYIHVEEVIGPNALAIATTLILLAYALSVDGTSKLDSLIGLLWGAGCVFFAVSSVCLVVSIWIRNHLRGKGNKLPFTVAASYLTSIFLYFISFLVAIAVID